MSSRRFHKKSRTGCTSCRSRRIKCDEMRPNCANCQRADLSCHYVLRMQESTSSARRVNIEQNISPASPQAQAAPDRKGGEFDLLDLRLMHHFTLVISASLFEDRQQSLWQEEVPIQAASCPLLMHGILAISALHLALSKLEEVSLHFDRALYHHTLSLQIFNREITASNSSNVHLHFAFSILLIVWAYGSSAAVDDQYIQLDSLLGSLELVRGCKSMFELHSDDIKNQEIGRFLGLHASATKRDLSSTTQHAFACLRSKAEDFIDTMAIDHMERHIQFVGIACDIRSVIGWPAVLDDTFWARIRAYKPVAMLILVHYCMLLDTCKNHWWIAGWSGRLIKAVERVLPDSEKRRLDWATHITWIRDEIINSA
ncbi:putative Zn(II)2Cys6 transcription factor [Aspergillus japonicus CBS 114.51]|uniref:Putative Zn(II)2Cys6 transcription factor n=1 Tax=Aspergillus japonicus CBS 114.51 TaxID=1448312 RepID=A0A8T8WJ06_ASPJA|nr:putative Zn(II)2Cys6 transcription factor [Aspergillus japonicus CBS 114.51]RAH75755.1 putative Zn(II)2Cys6 transcription factor [Aspergillus japonicus CBS 114.51]